MDHCHRIRLLSNKTIIFVGLSFPVLKFYELTILHFCFKRSSFHLIKAYAHFLFLYISHQFYILSSFNSFLATAGPMV